MSKSKFNKYLRNIGFKTICNENQLTQQMTKEYQIEIILSEINWERIHRTMTLLNWGYYDFNENNTRIPTIEELKIKGRKLLEDVWNRELDDEPYISFTCGGFEAEKVEIDGLKILNLKFVLTEWGFDYDSVQMTPQQYLSPAEFVEINRKLNVN